MNYEIFSYGNVDALSGLFNAIASVTASGIFGNAIALVMAVGFFGAFLAFAFAPQRLHGPKWLASVILIYLAMFVPKATVQVVDKTGTTPPAVISNVPLGLAAQAGIVSSIGSTLTELFETALTVLPGPSGLPAELTFSNNGMMFGARLVEHSRKVVFDDPRMRTDVANYLRNCTFYDVSQGYIPANVFASSTDLWTLAADTNPARFTGVTNLTTNIVEPLACPAAYATINARIPAAVNSVLTKIGLDLNPYLQLAGTPTLPGAAALTLITSQLPTAYQRAMIGNASENAAKHVLQNVMINSVKDASSLMSQAQGDTSALLMQLARTQAATQINSQSLVSSSMMSEALPLIRNGIEAMLYGIFPLVLLLALVFGGLQAVQMLKAYALGLVWIAMWPPIYAIVNYLGTLAWIKKAAAAAYIPGASATGLTLSTATPIIDATMSSMSTMGNMVLAVPMIAGALVFGLNKITGMAMTMSQAVTTATGPIANQTAVGNVSLGNAQLQQQALGPTRSSAYMESMTDARGTSVRDVQTGDFRYTQTIGKSAAGLMSSTEIATRATESSAKAHATAIEQSRAAERATAGAFASILAWEEGRSKGSAGSSGTQHGNHVGRDHAIDQALQIRDQFARSLAIQDQSQAATMLALALSASAGTPGAPVLKDIIPRIQASLSASGESRSVEQITAAIDEATSAAKQHGINRLDKLTENYGNSEEFRHLSQENRGLSERIAAEVRSSQSYRSGATASYREADEYRQMAEFAESSAISGKLDWTPEFHTWMDRYHRDKLGATGEELWALQKQFFREGGIGISANGKPSFSLYDGYGPGNVTRHPVEFGSEAHNDPILLRHRALAANVGGSHASAASYGYQGENVVRGAADAADLDAGPAPTPVDGERLEKEYRKARQQGIDAYNARGQALKDESEQNHNEFVDRAGSTSWAHNLIPDRATGQLDTVGSSRTTQVEPPLPAPDLTPENLRELSREAVIRRTKKLGAGR